MPEFIEYMLNSCEVFVNATVELNKFLAIFIRGKATVVMSVGRSVRPQLAHWAIRSLVI